MTLNYDAFAKAVTFLAMIGVVLGALIGAVVPAKAFYGSLNRDGNPVWECYDHPDHCK
jgi:hypothetical protein